MRAAAEGMAALGIDAEVVLTSPLIRCRQTAEIVCAWLGGEPVEDARLARGWTSTSSRTPSWPSPDAG